jgi:acyl-CoA synthetase (AMP-forming)/AMP-acid ligase II
MFLGDWRRRRAMLTPGKVAMVDATRGHRPITYREWDRSANRTAKLLQELGVGKRDRVALLAYNSVAYLDLWFACGMLGAILQTLNWRLTPRELGELLIRGPHVCAGYWNRPDETARTIRDGWLHTGDLARRDAEGYYFIVGRLKDVIISGGENVYPAEVEGVLAGHPAVAEVALIGVPDARWGEAPRAIVVPRAGTSIDPAELVAFAEGRLARYKIPRSFVLVDALPRTAAGKVDKERLKKEHGGP